MITCLLLDIDKVERMLKIFLVQIGVKENYLDIYIISHIFGTISGINYDEVPNFAYEYEVNAFSRRSFLLFDALKIYKYIK